MIKGVDDALLKDAARRTEGFSGRELAKMMASAQAAAYGSADGALTADMFKRVRVKEVARYHLFTPLFWGSAGGGHQAAGAPAAPCV